MEIVAAKNVSKNYRMGLATVPALKDVSISIDKGDFVIIVGPSGSGKSTLIHILGALDRPSSGEVFIEGKNISGLDDWHLAMLRRKKIGFIFQQFNLIPTLTALENVIIPTEPISGEKDSYIRRAKQLLKDVGLAERITHKPSEMSGGEMQRVSIARALINDPEIIFADEPTGNLDSVTGKKIVESMKEMNEKRNKTFVIVTHDQSLLDFANKKVFMRDGSIVQMDGHKEMRKLVR